MMIRIILSSTIISVIIVVPWTLRLGSRKPSILRLCNTRIANTVGKLIAIICSNAYWTRCDSGPELKDTILPFRPGFSADSIALENYEDRKENENSPNSEAKRRFLYFNFFVVIMDNRSLAAVLINYHSYDYFLRSKYVYSL
jgi:hypothetical protein